MATSHDESDAMPAIWPPFEAFYIESMLFNSGWAIESLDYVIRAMQHIEAGSDESPDHAMLLTHLQNVVVQGGSLSRYFWPSSGSYEARGAQLREAFAMRDDSPLRERGLRNAMEHFDERLDDYLRTDVVGVVLPEYVGPMPGAEDVPGHFFRAFFIDVGVFQLLGKRYPMQPIADEIVRVHNLLIQFRESGGRFGRSGT